MSGDNRANIDDIDPDLNHYTDNVTNFRRFSIDSFNQVAKLSNNTFNLFHNNARSIMADGRLDDYNLLFKGINNPFHIICFTETWLTEYNKDLCQFEGYTPVHILRPKNDYFDFKERGGGVSIFIKNSIKFRYRVDLSLRSEVVECIFIESTYNNKKSVFRGIVCLY